MVCQESAALQFPYLTALNLTTFASSKPGCDLKKIPQNSRWLVQGKLQSIIPRRCQQAQVWCQATSKMYIPSVYFISKHH
uniref:Uncharacterized protein n=1 Tax=Rhizophora mucronata TaxID=61149 RepID=A0A2P2PLS4_RHIMU